jgi:putative DNA primase/helicase
MIDSTDLENFREYKASHLNLFPPEYPEEKQFLVFQGIMAREIDRSKKIVETVRQDIEVKEPDRIKVDPAFAEYNFTDFGNAERFILKTSGNILYAPQNDSWYLWNGGGYWTKDQLGIIRELAKATLRSIYAESDMQSTPERRAACSKWAISCEKNEHVTSCLKLASSDPGVAVRVDRFDQNIHYFNLLNGTYDLKNHQLLQHSKYNYLTKQATYEYDPEAKCPHFMKFIERLFRSRKDKAEIIEYLQKALGYSLTGETSQQVIFLLYGSGANGKSTLMETMRMVMGDYGTTIDSSSLTTKKNDGVRNDIARLPNVRFVVASENSKGTILDEELVKKLSGGDEVTARFLFQEEFTFYPRLKLWWAFNHPPGLQDFTHSLMRRLKLIPFEETIGPEEMIDQAILLGRFREELPGILNWLIEGLKKFQAEGLKDIPAVTTAVKAFKEEQDILFDFIRDCCYIPTPEDAMKREVLVLSSRLYQRYRAWADESHERVISQNKFSREMRERGFKSDHTMTGNVFRGIEIK